jgi:hypothetical protein
MKRCTATSICIPSLCLRSEKDIQCSLFILFISVSDLFNQVHGQCIGVALHSIELCKYEISAIRHERIL